MEFNNFYESDRVNFLQTKLQNIQQSLESDKIQRLSDLERQLDQLEDQLYKNQQTNERKLNQIQTPVSEMTKMLLEESDTSQKYLSKRKSTFKQLYDQLKNAMYQLDNSNQKIEKKVMQLLDNRIGGLQRDVKRDIEQRVQDIDYVSNLVNNDMPRLQKQFNKYTQDKQKIEKDLKEWVSQSYKEFHDRINQEGHQRQETEQAMHNMIDEIFSKLEQEIAQDKLEREAAEEQILNLLEDTCSKLNSLTID